MKPMRKCVIVVLALLVCALPTATQTDAVKLKVRVILIDKDLNQKPVPRLGLTVRNVVGGDPVPLKTGFDGQAEAVLPAGKYQLATPEPVEFQGKKYAWEMEFTLDRGEHLLELTNDNAKMSGAAAAPPRGDGLAEHFQRLQHSVVTVWVADGRGTGFIVDRSGLVLTNQHVASASEYLAVQFDATHKLRARLLASDVDRDVAVLWVNLQQRPDVVLAPLAETTAKDAPVMVGERVFTIGNPLGQDKVLTTGVVSKVEEKTIISDVNINPGSSGGPLFNSTGQVVGITTFGEQARRGPGLSGIVRIEQALPLLEQARSRMSGGEAPSPALLPVDPTDKMPLEMLRTVLAEGKLNTSLYEFSIGEFEVVLFTPVLDYYYDLEREKALAKEREKRKKKSGTVTEDKPEKEAEYKPFLLIRARPKLRVKKSSFFVPGPLKYNFKSDFRKMRLLCGSREVEPIHPLRVETVVNVEGTSVQAVDRTFVGLYRYVYDAISPSCGGVTIELYSEVPDQPALVKLLDPGTVARIWADFGPYRKTHQAAATTPSQPE